MNNKEVTEKTKFSTSFLPLVKRSVRNLCLHSTQKISGRMIADKVASKVEVKVGILLTPHQLITNYRVLETLYIYRSAKSIDFKAQSFEMRELQKNYPTLNKEVKDAFLPFCSPSVEAAQQSIKQRLNKQRAGVSPETFVHNAMLRHVHQAFERLKPFSNLVRWYHKTLQGNGRNYKTSPCAFSTFKPQLSFEVKKENERFQLVTYVVLNGARYNIRSFSKHHFLLESSNEYFLLSFKDYQTLDWLEEKDVQQYSHDGALFSSEVLSRLEADYAVERNNLFTKKQLETLPVNRVLLSELNNSFLMITPQWVYDGFIVEGPWKETYETAVNGEEVIIKRSKEAEQSFLKLLVSLHANFTSQRNGYYYLPFAEAQKKQWFLKAYHKMLELGIEVTGMDMLQHFRYSPYKAETSISIKSETGSRVILKMQVQFGKEEIALSVLQKMLLAGQKAILLKDGSLGVLGDEWLQQYAAIIKHGKIAKDEVDVARFMFISERQTSSSPTEAFRLLIKEQWWQKWKQWQNSEGNIYTIPASVKATLRPYQQKGFEWLTLLAEAGAGACLADDMGLGKTLQTICFLAYRIHHNPTSANIIVCPSSLIYNWQQELQKFTPGISSVVYHGNNRNADSLKDKQVIITSYGTLRVDADVLLQYSYDVAVIDESHNIKNPSAQITGLVNMLNANTRIALSGTPVVNNTFDLYAQLNFALPGMFGSREFFKREYADAIDRYHDEEKIKTLQKLTAPFILRRTKEQVAKDLPSKTETILWCNMSREQQNLYDGIKDQVRSSLFMDIKSNGLNKSKLAVLQGMLKLRQICNSPLLLPQDEQQSCTASVKTEVLISELKNISGNHKALVFSQFTTMLDLLTEECDRQGISYYHFDGQTPPAKRAEMVNAFQQKDNTTKVFLISLKAGNTGLTLTAADYVFLFDPWWNTAVEQQAIDRTHRIGQTKNVFAYKIICKGTIEEKIIQLQQRKKQLAEELVAEDDSFIKTLTEDDINYLFS